MSLGQLCSEAVFLWVVFNLNIPHFWAGILGGFLYFQHLEAILMLGLHFSSHLEATLMLGLVSAVSLGQLCSDSHFVGCSILYLCFKFPFFYVSHIDASKMESVVLCAWFHMVMIIESDAHYDHWIKYISLLSGNVGRFSLLPTSWSNSDVGIAFFNKSWSNSDVGIGLCCVSCPVVFRYSHFVWCSFCTLALQDLEAILVKKTPCFLHYGAVLMLKVSVPLSQLCFI